MSLDPPPVTHLSGTEPFDGIDASVADFWRFAMSDLRTNNVRGYLAEFLVARALGSTMARIEWDPWDVTAPDGTRVEVKSSGYLQAWAQKRLSRPTFQVAAAHGWDQVAAARSAERGFNADAYVFCLHTATDHATYDPLAVSQWEFYVAGRRTVEALAGASMGLATLNEVAGPPRTWSQLKDAITLVGAESRNARIEWDSAD